MKSFIVNVIVSFNKQTLWVVGPWLRSF